MPLIRALLLTLAFSSAIPAADKIDFNRDVRPILSNKCLTCHGPDPEGLQAGLRLDHPETAMSQLESGKTAIVANVPERSELLVRVTTSDEDLRMPPADHGDRLSGREVDILKQWILEGAPFARHWAYVKPTTPAVPEIRDEDRQWIRNNIDAFVLDGMIRHGLRPSDEADRYSIVRRVFLDLTGLPPSLEEVDAFVGNTDSDAYEQLVDDLLNRPAFGEHWARLWLDLARYADSAGYADDPPRTIWAYRDWVIRAFNADMPFNQFTVEQLAGDLLPNASEDQLIATAFHRNTLTNNEGGTQDEEFRNVAVVDRVNTTMAVWMGTTMACAQCHNHKYDPISQEEYFRFFAVFNNTQDADRRDEGPTLELFTAEQKERKRQLEAQIAALDDELARPTEQLQRSQNQWEERLRKPADWVTVRPSAIQLSQGGTADIAADGSVLVRPGDVSVDSYTVDLPLEAGDKAGSSGLAAIQLQTLPHPDLPGSGTGYGGGNFVITGIRAQLISEEPQVPVARYVRITNKGKNKILSLAEVEVFSQGGNVASRGKATQHSTAFSGPPERAIDGNSDGDYQKNSVTHTETVDDPWWELDLGRDIGIEQLVIWNRTDNGLHSRLDGLQVQLLASDRSEVKNYSSSQPPNPSVSFTEDGVRGLVFRTAFADYHQPGFEPMTVVSNAGNAEQGWAIGGATTQPHELTLVAKKPETVPHNSGLRLVIDQQSKHAKHLLGQFAVRVTGDPVAVERSQLPVDLLAVVDKPEAGRSAEDRDRLADYYRRNLAPELADQRHKLAVARKSLKEMKPATSVPILRERSDQPRVTHLQYRGNYLDLGPVVQPGLPDAFDIPDLSQQPDRMTVAKWLTDDNNPLTARVLANRIWETIFGRGIVVTSEEFGSQGELPTHPELLDWLATELYRNGWSRKELIRTIVTSSTYRQQVSVSAQKLATDPDNLWLSRGPRVRLSAEMVRDQALFVSGLLSLEQFGPPVNPPQPSLGLTAAFGSSTDWKTSQGKDRYRRALYTTWRRSNPYPSMAAFDAPNREVCTIRRNRTNTPLQSLVTLNDPVYVEAAQALARLVLQEQKSLDDQITLAFRRCLARPPRASELNTLTALFRDAREGISKQPAEALKLATDPLGALPDVVNVHDAAAMTVVCNILLNLDEIFMKR